MSNVNDKAAEIKAAIKDKEKIVKSNKIVTKC